jgi:predicted alpha/beta superfamily hydrolase
MLKQGLMGNGLLRFLLLGMLISGGIAPPCAGQAQSDISEHKIFSDILREERFILISLPLGYKTGQDNYPVLYILDAEGTNTFQNGIATVQDLAEKGLMPPMILVGIKNTHRNRDMIPQTVSHRPGSGGSQKFLRFITDELQPHIKKHFRTKDFTLLYGMSNSALFCVYALLEKPDSFNAFIASSPMIGHCPDYIQKMAQSFTRKIGSEQRWLYMIYGTEDSARVTEFVPDLRDFLRSRSIENLSIQLEILPGEGHVPKNGLRRGLIFIFKK